MSGMNNNNIKKYAHSKSLHKTVCKPDPPLLVIVAPAGHRADWVIVVSATHHGNVTCISQHLIISMFNVVFMFASSQTTLNYKSFSCLINDQTTNK